MARDFGLCALLRFSSFSHRPFIPIRVRARGVSASASRRVPSCCRALVAVIGSWVRGVLCVRRRKLRERALQCAIYSIVVGVCCLIALDYV